MWIFTDLKIPWTLFAIDSFCSSFDASWNSLIVCPHKSIKMIKRKVIMIWVRIIVIDWGCSPWEWFEEWSIDTYCGKRSCKSQSCVTKPHSLVFRKWLRKWLNYYHKYYSMWFIPHTELWFKSPYHSYHIIYSILVLIPWLIDILQKTHSKHCDWV